MSDVTMLRAGITMRWLNNAGFEVVLPGGAHLLVDPWLDSAEIYPVQADRLERDDQRNSGSKLPAYGLFYPGTSSVVPVRIGGSLSG